MLAALVPRCLCVRSAALRSACAAAATLHAPPVQPRSRVPVHARLVCHAALPPILVCADVSAPAASAAAASPQTGGDASPAAAQSPFDREVTSDASFAAFLTHWTATNSTMHPHTDGRIAQSTSTRPVCVVAVSGGVDSAVTALLCTAAASAGLYSRVVAVHMRNWDEIEERGVCSGEKDALDAARLCASLNLPLEFLDFSREYFTDVFQPLLDEYAKGCTPSPDVLCNRLIKFNLLLEQVRHKFGADAVLATGHYARLKHDAGENAPSSTTINSPDISRTDDNLPARSFSHPRPVTEAVPPSFEPHLYKALDSRKDQSYFLSSVPASALKHTVFPLGTFHKSFVKNTLATGRWAESIIEQRAQLPKVPQAQPIAWRSSTSAAAAAASASDAAALPSPTQPALHALSAKKESMGICFIGKRDLGDFLSGYLTLHPGWFVDVDTRRAIQEHQGWETWTMGQRAPISGAPQKMYVCAKNAAQLRPAGASADSEPFLVTPLAPAVTAPRLSHRSFSPQGKLIVRRDPRPAAPLPVPPPPWTVWVCSSRMHPTLWCDDMELDTPEWISAQEPRMEEQDEQRDQRLNQHAPLRREWRMSVSIKIRSGAEQTPAVLVKTAHDSALACSSSFAAVDATAASPAPVVGVPAVRFQYRIESARPLHAVTPGQSCVLYDASGQRCLGQARIAQAGLSYFQRNKPLPFHAETSATQTSPADSATPASSSPTASATGVATGLRSRSLPLRVRA